MHYISSTACGKVNSKFAEISFMVILHPLNSPDFFPSDYYLFCPMKNSLCGKMYQFAEEVNHDLESWFVSKPAEFYANDKTTSRTLAKMYGL